jgi:S-adenosylmethionine hydrolase
MNKFIPSNIITLVTDFGEKDHYVGVLKGVIYNINSWAKVIDICHHVAPQDINEAVYVWSSSPEVGTKRKIIALVSDKYVFISPDNGIPYAINKILKVKEIIEINNKKYFREDISATFHGRDIFAPVAAHLSVGEDIHNMGGSCKELSKGKLFQPKIDKGKVEANIIHIDNFGNLITNINYSILELKKDAIKSVVLNENKAIDKICEYYSQGDNGDLIALWGSSGFLEIAQVSGNASKATGISKNAKIEVNI